MGAFFAAVVAGPIQGRGNGQYCNKFSRCARKYFPITGGAVAQNGLYGLYGL
jgi:hypothetical protein